MAWDVVMFGSLSIPQQSVEDWLSTVVSRDEFPWLDDLGGTDVMHDTPELLLSFLRDITVAPHEIFRVDLSDGQVRVQCYVSEDPYRETSQALAMLFASSAHFGGQGELVFYGYQGIRFGERLSVGGGNATFTRLGQAELGNVERMKDFTELNAKIHERFDSLVGRPETPMDPRRSKLVVHPFTGRKVRVADDAGDSRR